MPHVISAHITDQCSQIFGIRDIPQVTIESPKVLYYLRVRIKQMNAISIETRFD